MIEVASAPETWAGATEAHRYRVEARVAAAVCRARHISQLSARSIEAARLYEGAWKARAEDWVSRQPTEQIDVGTAAFLVWGLVPEERLNDLGRIVLSIDNAEN
jgi:hypothetical protein